MQAEIRGRDLVSGLPKTVVLTSEEVRARARGAARADHRRDQGDARPHAARARLRHHGSRHHARRRRQRCSRASTSACARRRRCPPHRAESPLTCVAVGSRPLPRGVRGDPPLQPLEPPQPPQSAPLASSLDRPPATPTSFTRMHDKSRQTPPCSAGRPRRGLADPAHRLFRRVLERPPARRAARCARRALRPIQEGAEPRR